ncbi:MAG TPA: hypothetical protein VKF28_08530 [Candidatus Dormibacteraeota bacterium]|nr:hypothetical protein [Candidatus Dormibacteraeota bacterium]
MTEPRWIWSTLMTGAAILLFWGIFVLSFKSEPSAVGRLGIGLIIIGGASIGTAIVGAVAAIGLLRHARWGTSAAWLASVLMVLTVISSWAGVIGLFGLITSRFRSRT